MQPTSRNGHRFEPSRGALGIGAGDGPAGGLHLRLRSGPEAAAESRHALDRLEGVVERERLETLRLLVSELVTNSVRHGAGADDWIELDVRIGAQSIHVEVVDRGPGFQPAGPPTPHRDRPGGWGLCLVDRLADRWGVSLEERTRVWFDLRFRSGFAGAA